MITTTKLFKTYPQIKARIHFSLETEGFLFNLIGLQTLVTKKLITIDEFKQYFKYLVEKALLQDPFNNNWLIETCSGEFKLKDLELKIVYYNGMYDWYVKNNNNIWVLKVEALNTADAIKDISNDFKGLSKDIVLKEGLTKDKIFNIIINNLYDNNLDDWKLINNEKILINKTEKINYLLNSTLINIESYHLYHWTKSNVFTYFTNIDNIDINPTNERYLFDCNSTYKIPTYIRKHLLDTNIMNFDQYFHFLQNVTNFNYEKYIHFIETVTNFNSDIITVRNINW